MKKIESTLEREVWFENLRVFRLNSAIEEKSESYEAIGSYKRSE